MAIQYAAKIWERATVTGTGNVSLTGATPAPIYQNFASGLTSGNQTFYGIEDQTAGAWEMGIGTWTVGTSPAGTLTRSTVIASSNSNALVSFAGNTCNVTCEIPPPILASAGSGSAGKLLALNASGLIDNTALTQVKKNGADGSNVVTLTAATTLTASQSGLTFLLAGTANYTVTLPGATLGLEYSFFQNSSTGTISIAAASGGHFIGPDGATIASPYTVFSDVGEFIQIVADGSNWRIFTVAQPVVAPATNANQAVQLGQVQNCAPVSASSDSLSASSMSATTGTLTAPSNGIAFAVMLFGFSNESLSLSGTGLSASLSGLQTLSPISKNHSAYLWPVFGYLPMTAGQSTTFTGSVSLSGNSVCNVTVVAFFLPLG